MEIFLELCEMHVATLPGYGKVVLAHLEGCNENSFFDFDAPLPVKQSKSINWYGPWPLQPIQYCTKYYSKCNIFN